jgi:UDP-N-acetylmuramyl pentapeptide phosphotransferase/UDP-N-acetylglucosamine-1-phosphate transferase
MTELVAAGGFAAIAAGLLCAGLILLLRPLLVRYALARPNARSSHTIPTPQGGGIAVIVATLATSAAAVALWPSTGWPAATEPLALAAATLLLATTGATDDIRPLGAGIRLLLQAVAVALALGCAIP